MLKVGEGSDAGIVVGGNSAAEVGMGRAGGDG